MRVAEEEPEEKIVLKKELNNSKWLPHVMSSYTVY